MNYKSIEILEKYGAVPTKIRIFMEDGTIEEVVTSEENKISVLDNECFKKLQQLYLKETDKYESTIDFIKNNPKISEKLSEKEIIVEPTEKIIEETTKKEEKIDKKEEPKKERKFSKGIKITSIVLASLIGISGIGYTLHNVFFKQKDNNKSNQTPKKSIVTTIDYKDPIENAFNERLDGIVKNEETLRETLSDIVKGNEVNDDKLLKALGDQAAISLSNMTEVSNFINGSKLEGNVVLPEYQQLFINDEEDYAAVEKFNILHNNIVYTAYNNKNVNATKKHIDEFNKHFVELVFAGNEFTYKASNGQQEMYCFDDLSPMAKNTIVQMGMMVLDIDRDFNFDIDGVSYNRQKCIEDVSVISAQLVNEIKNNGKHK